MSLRVKALFPIGKNYGLVNIKGALEVAGDEGQHWCTLSTIPDHEIFLNRYDAENQSC
jgi:hypothetical protein